MSLQKQYSDVQAAIDTVERVIINMRRRSLNPAQFYDLQSDKIVNLYDVQRELVKLAGAIHTALVGVD